MTPSPTLEPEFLEALRTRLQRVHSEFTRRYPGESLRRQPVHTVYGGAQVFKSDTVPKMVGQAIENMRRHFAGEALLSPVAV